MANLPKSVPFNDLRRAISRQRVALSDRLAEVVDSGWFVQGANHDAFEREFAAFLGVGNCIGVANGTDALEIALRVVTAGRTGSVVMAGNAGGYAASAARRSGLTILWADIDPEWLLLDPLSVGQLLESQPVVAVVATHLYGNPVRMQELARLCREASVPLVEDCAQAAGARDGAVPVGTMGDIAAFSFYPTKNLGALGDAGAITTNTKELADEVRRMRQYGWGRKYIMEAQGGQNSRLDEIQAAVLRLRLLELPTLNDRRRSILQAYCDASSARIRMIPAKEHLGVAHLAVGLCDDRNQVRAQLRAQGIATEVHYPLPDHLQLPLAGQYNGWPLPVTEVTAHRILSLPCFPDLTDFEIEYVCQQLAAL